MKEEDRDDWTDVRRRPDGSPGADELRGPNVPPAGGPGSGAGGEGFAKERFRDRRPYSDEGRLYEWYEERAYGRQARRPLTRWEIRQERREQQQMRQLAHRRALLEQRERMIAQRRELRERLRDSRAEQPSRPPHFEGRQTRWYHALFAVTAFFCFFTLCWTAAHYLTVYLGPYWPYGQLHPTLRDYVALMIALLLFGFCMRIIGWIVRPEQRVANVFTAMVDAMQRMSKGDFNINIEAHPRYAGQFSVLVENLNRMAAELGQMEQMRQEFISNVSHEIQSPLTAIKGFAQALRQEDMDSAARDHYLKIIETESERMSRMSENLIRLTTLESRSQPFRLGTFRLDRQIRQAVLSCEPLWSGKKLEMDIQLDEVSVEADEELLNQVWRNLLHNSIKFTPEGGTLSIGLAARDGRAEATFADTGIGISEADLPHLFERFYKADKARSRALGGSGLGLSIVKKIVDLHEGEITVDSRPGEGATFTVRLPLQAADSLRRRA